MYHFPTKEALMLGLSEFAAQHWSGLLHEHAGAEPAALTPFDRHRAYVTGATTAEVSRADYWVFSDVLYHPALAEAWTRHLGPWFDTAGTDPCAESPLTDAQFCADGAWAAEATGVFPARDLGAGRTCALGLIDEAERFDAADGAAGEPGKAGRVGAA